MNINVNLKETNKQLKRIADYLELWLKDQGLGTQPLEALPPEEEAEVGYRDEVKAGLEEWFRKTYGSRVRDEEERAEESGR
jgi:hypothetical protein